MWVGHLQHGSTPKGKMYGRVSLASAFHPQGEHCPTVLWDTAMGLSPFLLHGPSKWVEGIGSWPISYVTMGCPKEYLLKSILDIATFPFSSSGGSGPKARPFLKRSLMRSSLGMKILYIYEQKWKLAWVWGGRMVIFFLRKVDYNGLEMGWNKMVDSNYQRSKFFFLQEKKM